MQRAFPTCVILAIHLALPFLHAQQPAAAMRQWTDAQGRTMQAALKGIQGDQVQFVTSDGQTLSFPLARLSPADQAYVKNGGSAAPAGAAAPTPPRTTPQIPPEQRTWPKVVEVSTKSIEINPVEENPAANRCVYRSESFEFISEDKLAAAGVVREIARTFEATRALLMALPWGVDPRPPADLGRYQAKFYRTRESYIAEGGPENSGGVYSSGDRIFRIPFQSLGLKMVGKTWAKDDNYRNDTIIHEITHQLMHDYLGLLPTWIVEGTAEYTESLPYNAGTFQAAKHESGLKDYIKRRADSEGMTLSQFRPFEEHAKMPRSDWNTIAENPEGQHRGMRQLYFQSYVTVYYFCHLDGDGKGTRFLKYFDAMAGQRAKWAAYEVEFAAYRKAMEEFFKLPGVKKLEDGRFSYPRSLTPPKRPERPDGANGKDFGMEQLEILYDGRTGTQIEAQMKEGFKKIGVRW